MTTRGIHAQDAYQPSIYWEDRARRFATHGDGLGAVCAYGMPEFYNRMIHFCQRLALAPWLRVGAGMRVLDVGCGVGRWSRLMAAQGAHVTGVDLSPTMIAQAKQRAAKAGLASHCRFLTQDLAALDAGERFDLVVGVTVLQHILDPIALRAAIRRMAAHLAREGRMILLEAAPTRFAHRCDSSVFQARHRNVYLRLFAECGLRARAVTGVDPAPFKTWLLPHLPRLPRPLSLAALAVVTALTVPVDAIFGRRAVERSWHAVFVLEHSRGEHHAHQSFHTRRERARARWCLRDSGGLAREDALGAP